MKTDRPVEIDREDYDPNWAARHAQALRRVDSLTYEYPPEVRQAAIRAMWKALDAQFKTVADYAHHRLERCRRHAESAGFLPAFPPLASGAKDSDIDALAASAYRQIDEAVHLSRRPAPGQPDGLVAFGETLRPQWCRLRTQITVCEEKMPPYSRAPSQPQVWTLLIEHRGRHADVCLIAPEDGLGPEWGPQLATVIYNELLRAPPLRPWLGCSRSKANYYYCLPSRLDGPEPHFFMRMALRWKGGRYHDASKGWPRWRRFGRVPAAVAACVQSPSGSLILIPAAETIDGLVEGSKA